MLARLSSLLLPLLAASVGAQTRVHDVIYMKAGGTAFTLDVLKPAKPNGAAVLFMVSGGWISDHTMIDNFFPDLEKAYAAAGFTIFAVVHGAQPRYKVTEIVDQVRTAVRFVRTHAGDYRVDPNRLGVTGISSGGHLALMIAGSPDSMVKAVAAIAPPTDLGNWGKPGAFVTDSPQLSIFFDPLGLDAMAAKPDNAAKLVKLSPITLVTAKFPSTLIVHGDADKIVPLEQAQTMDAALAKLGVDRRLDIIHGGGHDDSTFDPGMKRTLQWFKDKLLAKPSKRLVK